MVIWVMLKNAFMNPTSVPLVRLLLLAFPWINRNTFTLNLDRYTSPTTVVFSWAVLRSQQEWTWIVSFGGPNLETLYQSLSIRSKGVESL